ncbi:hypothetical protein MKEN_00804000 [Mycena kentingensis (nom. inval.)]|nr:hypothetical protein MKEN_00804000 [Mycena kentingensis (nom. inval.)]
MVSTSLFRLVLTVNLALAVSGLVVPRVPQGTQFITGPCSSDADCASGCCTKNTGKCGARAVAEGPGGGGGCGFGSDAGAVGAAPQAAAPPATLPPNIGGPPFDPAGSANVGNGAGKQFIGGQCLSEKDCASGCCAGPSGICSGVGAQTQAGKTGCGFVAGGASAAPPAAAAPVAASPATTAAAAPAAQGTQFITGACSSDADCASGCCTKNTGKCGARAVAEGPGGGGGCGFGSGSASSSPAPAAAAPAPANNGGAPVPAPGTQFITGACTKDADCASGCCTKNTGKCGARAVAEGPGGGGGCGFGA